MLESDKYAYVNIGNGVESVYVRIKKDTPIAETDKSKITAWAQEKGFTISNRKRILHAEWIQGSGLGKHYFLRKE